MKIIKLEKPNFQITMEQTRDGAKVKITVRSQMPWEARAIKETVWADVEDANKFYQKRLKDGYKAIY